MHFLQLRNIEVCALQDLMVCHRVLLLSYNGAYSGTLMQELTHCGGGVAETGHIC